MKDITMNIIFADDDSEERIFFKDAIASFSKKILIKFVNDGEELMEYLKTFDIKLPTILFLDLNMPGRSGIDCLTEIRQSPELQLLTIAIYSTSCETEDIHNCFVLGANVYIKKPNDFEILKKNLQKVISVNWQYQISDLSRETFFLTL